jgi:hypothetical protein
MQEISIPLPDSRWLVDHFRGYENPHAKIVSLERRKELIRLKRGLYVTSDALEKHLSYGCIANRLYGPSYVSFAYALRLYGLIPEHVPNVTSATRGKRHIKRFDTPLCSFFYRDVPAEVFHKEVVYREEAGGRYLIASPEKALCDELSTMSGMRTIRALKTLLFDDLRIDMHELAKLDSAIISELAPYYQSTTVDAFSRLTQKRNA